MKALEFRLHPKGINVIQKYIETDPNALKRWPACIYSFVTNACSRRRLRDEYKPGAYAEVIMETLEEWIGEQDSNATFRELIQMLRDQELNYLCGILLENLETIKNAQLTSKAVNENAEFPLHQRGIEIIQKHILRDPEALRKWPECIYTFVVNACSRMRLANKYQADRYAEGIINTLEGWLEEQGNNATFGQLIQLLKSHNLNHLCEKLIENAAIISNAQLRPTSTAITENTRNRNVWND